MVITLFFLSQILAKNWTPSKAHLCLLCRQEILFSRFVHVVPRGKPFNKDWRHCFIRVLKLTSMAFLFNRVILCGATVCALCYGKSGTPIYHSLHFSVTRFTKGINSLVSGYSVQMLSILSLCLFTMKALIFTSDHSLFSLYLHKANVRKKGLRIAYAIIRNQNYL